MTPRQVRDEWTMEEVIYRCSLRHLPLPGCRVIVDTELAPGTWSLGDPDRRRLSSIWLANHSPKGTPASSSDYRVFLINHDPVRDFEICPHCERSPMSYYSQPGRPLRMSCSKCNLLAKGLFPLSDSDALIARGVVLSISDPSFVVFHTLADCVRHCRRAGWRRRMAAFLCAAI